MPHAETAVTRANDDARHVVGTLRFVISVALLDIVAAGVALAIAAIRDSHGSFYVVAAVAAAGIGTLAALASVWTFQWIRAPVRQRDELRAALADLMATPPFPDVEITSTSLSRTQETLDGTDTPDANTVRVRIPIMVTNRERDRRVSLDFRLALYDTGEPEPFGRFFSDQMDELPLLVDAQNTMKTTLSFFMEWAFFTTPMIRSEAVRRMATADEHLPQPECRLMVRDHLSRQEIEIPAPGSYPP